MCYTVVMLNNTRIEIEIDGLAIADTSLYPVKEIIATAKGGWAKTVGQEPNLETAVRRRDILSAQYGWKTASRAARTLITISDDDAGMETVEHYVRTGEIVSEALVDAGVTALADLYNEVPVTF